MTISTAYNGPYYPANARIRPAYNDGGACLIGRVVALTGDDGWGEVYTPQKILVFSALIERFYLLLGCKHGILSIVYERTYT